MAPGIVHGSDPAALARQIIRSHQATVTRIAAALRDPPRHEASPARQARLVDALVETLGGLALGGVAAQLAGIGARAGGTEAAQRIRRTGTAVLRDGRPPRRGDASGILRADLVARLVARLAQTVPQLERVLDQVPAAGLPQAAALAAPDAAPVFAEQLGHGWTALLATLGDRVLDADAPAPWPAWQRRVLRG